MVDGECEGHKCFCFIDSGSVVNLVSLSFVKIIGMENFIHIQIFFQVKIHLIIFMLNF